MRNTYFLKKGTGLQVGRPELWGGLITKDVGGTQCPQLEQGSGSSSVFSLASNQRSVRRGHLSYGL